MVGFNCYQVRKFHTNEGKMIKKWSFNKNSYGLWYVRDSRNISGIVGIIFFLIMMIVFFSTTQKKNNDENTDEQDKISPRLKINGNSTCLKAGFCVKKDEKSIDCTDVYPEVMADVQKEINDMFAWEENTNGLSLSFNKLQNPEKIIIPGWLTNINVNLTSFSIRETALKEIKANSFGNTPFSNLQQLYLESNVDIRLNKDSFSGLKSLTSLILEGSKCQSIYAEEDTLLEVPLLSILQISGCTMSPEVLKNLTGGSPLFKLDGLKILDIEANSLEKVLSDSFTKVSNLESLYLDKSNLEGGLEPTAFRGTNLKQITMRATHVTKLPAGIFDFILPSLVHLDLSDNKWNCTCDFQWFQEMYVSMSWLFSNVTLLCYQNGYFFDLNSFPFCATTTTVHTTPPSTETRTGQYPSTTPEGTTDSTTQMSTSSHPFTTGAPPKTTSSSDKSTSTTGVPTELTTEPIAPSTSTSTTSQTTVPTESSSTLKPSPNHPTTNEVSTTYQPFTTSVKPTTENPDDYDPIQCFPANRSSPLFNIVRGSDVRVMYLGRENLRFSFTQIGNEPKYHVTVDRTLGDDLILIFMNRAGWILCLSQLQDNFNVENLDYGQSYIVCMLRSSQYTVSPRNCQSLNVPEEWGKQSWITNDNKLPVLIGVCSGLISVLLVSLCGMYTYIKRNPYVVYGKDNVIVVERKNSKKITVQDQNYEQPRYPPSLVSWSDGYITPKLYESVEEFSVPCIDQYPSDLRMSRILPVIRRGHLGSEDLDSIYRQSGEIYETINTCPSPYYSNYDFSQNTYSSL